MAARYLLVATCAAAIGFSAGLLTERYLAKNSAQASVSSVGAVISPPPPPKFPLTRGPEFATWLTKRASQPLEPILHPADLIAAIYPCGQTPSPCSVQRTAFQETISELRREPSRMREIARCMLDGCDGAVAKLPANACLWWSLYLVQYSRLKGAMDERYQADACASARLGPEERAKSIAGEWEREAKLALGLSG